MAQALKHPAFEGVLYRDLNDPMGVGILAMHQDPTFFVTTLRDLLEFRSLPAAPPEAEYDDDRPHLCFRVRRRLAGLAPAQTAAHGLQPGVAVGHLVSVASFRRFFETLTQEQGAILREHGTIGRAYGDADLAHDVRLACHGLDLNDNDFLIGLIGRELHPLSHIVQTMRKTKQTSEFIQSLGPFFVGHALWQASPRIEDRG